MVNENFDESERWAEEVEDSTIEEIEEKTADWEKIQFWIELLKIIMRAPLPQRQDVARSLANLYDERDGDNMVLKLTYGFSILSDDALERFQKALKNNLEKELQSEGFASFYEKEERINSNVINLLKLLRSKSRTTYKLLDIVTDVNVGNTITILTNWDLIKFVNDDVVDEDATVNIILSLDDNNLRQFLIQLLRGMNLEGILEIEKLLES